MTFRVAAAYWMVAVLAGYYLLAWLLVGRKRAARSIAVRYEPPEGLSPAGIRYLYTMTSDGRTYAAIVAQLAAKRVLAIIPDPAKQTIILERLTHEHSLTRDLPAEEANVFSHLFEWDDQVELKQPELSAVDHIQQALQKRLGRRYLTRNFAWVVFGLLFTAVVTLWLGLSSDIFGSDVVESWMEASFAALAVVIYGLAGYWIWDTNRLAFTLALRGLYRRRTLPLLLGFIVLYPALWYVLIHTVAPQFAIITTAMIPDKRFCRTGVAQLHSRGQENAR